MVAKAIAPDFGTGPHTASLGLVFYTGAQFPASYRGGAFIGEHGSWNRKPLNGYQVVFIPFAGGKPQNAPQAFLTGFLDKHNQIQGRPVGVVVDKTGALLVADDVGGVVWRVSTTPAKK
jgi:glucose/arabinose dehydrogenase